MPLADEELSDENLLSRRSPVRQPKEVINPDAYVNKQFALVLDSGSIGQIISLMIKVGPKPEVLFLTYFFNELLSSSCCHFLL